jgi:peptide-methionine (R)-S-oxide reductase
MLLWVANRQQPVGDVRVKRSAEEWKSRLSPSAYHVLISRGTEAPFTSELEAEKRAGMYMCAGCGAPCYKSEDKFDSGTGWPSFVAPAAADALRLTLQPLYCLGDLGAREVRCAACGGHHGHVFSDGPKSRGGKRFCINGAALALVPQDGQGAGGDTTDASR